MENFLNSLDDFAESVLKIYKTSGWLRHNRTGLGLIAIILFFVGLFSGLHFGVLIVVGLIGVLNGSPIILAAYLAFRETSKEEKLLGDKKFLVEIRNKDKRGERLSEQEMRVYLANIQRKQIRGEKLTNEELCTYLLTNQEAMEHFLFRSNDNDFFSTLTLLRGYLSAEDFRFLISKVPSRINKLSKNNF